MNKLNNFSVYINSKYNSFSLYLSLCREYNINYDRSWSGNTVYYGIKNNHSFCDDVPFGSRVFHSIEEFEKFLKQEENNYEIF